MQQIIGIRDRLREEIEDLDGGYTTIAKLLNQTNGNITKTLKSTNTPRLATLERIRDAVDKAKRNQNLRIQQIVG